MKNIIASKYDKIINGFITFMILCILTMMILLVIHRIERKNYTCVTFYLPDGNVEVFNDITHIINKFNGTIEFTTKEGIVISLSDNYKVSRVREY